MSDLATCAIPVDVLPAPYARNTVGNLGATLGFNRVLTVGNLGYDAHPAAAILPSSGRNQSVCGHAGGDCRDEVTLAPSYREEGTTYSRSYTIGQEWEGGGIEQQTKRYQ